MQGNHGRRCRQRDEDSQQRVPDIQPQDFDEQYRQPKLDSPIADKRGDHAGFHIQQAAQDRRQHDDDGMKGGDENRVESTKKTMPIGMPMAIAGASWHRTTGQRRAVNSSTGMPDSRKPLR